MALQSAHFRGRDTVMPLTDTAVRNAKPRSTAYKIFDGGGMYLLVTSGGGCYWRLDYRFAGKRRTLALGVYPAVTLAKARASRERARELLAKDTDPSTTNKASKRAAQMGGQSTFRAVALEWLNKQRNRLAPRCC